ncbi:MAG: hypothetical protein U0T68_10680 [Ferruginibacter sp.]
MKQKSKNITAEFSSSSAAKAISMSPSGNHLRFAVKKIPPGMHFN